MKSTPEGSNKASKKPTLFIDKNDRRLNKQNIGKTLARSNAEVSFVDLSGLGGLAGANLRANSGLPAADAAGTGTGGAGSGSGSSYLTPSNAPLQVANLTAQYVGDSIQASFTFDTTDPANSYFSSFIVQVYNPGTSTYIPLQTFSTEALSKTSASQVLNINSSQLSYTGLPNLTVFTKIEIATFAAQYTLGYVESNTFAYVCDLPAPVITISHSVASYTVTITNFSTFSAISDFSSIAIQEFISGDTLAQVQAEDVAQTSIWNLAGPQTTTNTESFLAADGNHRWIRAYAYTKAGGKSPVSNYVDVTPDPINPSNLIAPNNVTAASAAWTGNNVVITFTQATSNPGATLNVKLVPVIDGNVSSSLYGYFNLPIVSGGATFTITQQQLLGIFGQYYTSFQAHVNTTSQQGVPSTGTIDIGTFSQTNTLTGFTPTASIVNAVSGYGVNFSLGTTGADYGEIYQFYQNPTFISSTSNPPDYMDADYQSGTGTSTLVVNNLTYEGGSMTIPSTTDPTQYFGYQITGTNLPSSANVFVSAISYNSGTQKYSLSLSYYDTSTGALTPYVLSSASGTYHMQCLVYSGSGPASIYNTLYNKPLYVVIAYYTYGGFRTNNSYPTYNYTATPINPAQSLISNSVQIGSGGAIYVGSSATTGSRIVLGPSGNKGPDGTSAYSGIFAFDYGSTSGSAASTAIITNPGASSYTFETTNALIANWAITTNNIQNLGSSGTYVGLSSNPSASYAIWAGAGTSGGDVTSKFTVTPGGAVVARSISIYGDGTNNTTLAIGGSAATAPFRVDAQGNMVASSATITGTLNVSLPSTFGSNINMTSDGIFSALGKKSDGITPATAGTSTTPGDGSRVQIRGGGFTDAANRSIFGGIFAYDTNNNITTWIVSKPIPFTLNGRTTGFTFQTSSALLGTSEGAGWIVQDSTIQSGNGRITLDASANTITVGANQNNYYGVVLSAAASADLGVGGTPTGNAIQAGLFSGPNFTVDHKGTLTATGATISGTLKSGARTSLTDTSPGFIFNSSDGSFIAGGSSTFIRYQGSTNPIELIGLGVSAAIDNGSTGVVPTAYTNSAADGAGARYSGYTSGSRIILNASNNGVNLFGMPIQKNTNSLGNSLVTAYENNYLYGLGALSRQRMLVEDPYDGMTRLGMAIYYQDSSGFHNTLPTGSGGANSGYVGDLWVVF